MRERATLFAGAPRTSSPMIALSGGQRVRATPRGSLTISQRFQRLPSAAASWRRVETYDREPALPY
jgi:hypothetical protein